MEAWREELYHGKEWKNHKYIRKEGNRYIYKEDLKGKNGKATMLPSGSGSGITSNIMENKKGANAPADLKDKLIDAISRLYKRNVMVQNGMNAKPGDIDKYADKVVRWIDDFLSLSPEEAFSDFINWPEGNALRFDDETLDRVFGGINRRDLTERQRSEIGNMIKDALRELERTITSDVFEKRNSHSQHSDTYTNELYHYAKGSTAKDHKYIRKEGNRYIYAESKGGTNKSGVGDWINNAASSIANWATNAAYDVDEALGGNARTVQRYRDKLKEAKEKEQAARDALDRANNKWLKAYQKWQSQYEDLASGLTFPKTILDDSSKATVLDPTKPVLAPSNTKKLREYIASGKSLRFLAEFTYADKTKLSALETAVKDEYAIARDRELAKARLEHAERDVAYYDEQLKYALSHNYGPSSELYHTAIGGTLIITRR